MSRIWIAGVVLLAAMAAGCGKTRSCKSGTVFLDVTLDSASASADTFDVSVTVGGATLTASGKHTPSVASGSIELDFPSKYPAGSSLTLTLTASANGQVVGTGMVPATTLPSGCAAIAVHVTAGSLNDGGVDLGDGAEDLSSTDLAGHDLLQTENDLGKTAGPDMAGGWVAFTAGGEGATYQAAYGSPSAVDVYVVGAADHDYIHYTNTNGIQGNIGTSLNTVWCNSAGTGWTGDGMGNIYQLVAGTSTQETIGTKAYIIQSIWGVGADSLLAIDGLANQLYTRASNGTWSSVTFGSSTVYNTVIWGTSTTNLYVSGFFTGSGNSKTPSIQHSADGINFSQQSLPAVAGGLFGLWGSSASDIYAVGTAGLILHSNDGSTWTQQSSGTTSDLNAVFGNSPSNVYAVGKAGTVLHSTGNGAWSSVTVPTINDLHAVWIAANGDAWAVGANGTILHDAR